MRRAGTRVAVSFVNSWFWCLCHLFNVRSHSDGVWRFRQPSVSVFLIIGLVHFLHLLFYVCFFVFLPSHSDMRVKIWNPKMGKKRWRSSVWNDCYRWCLFGLIGRHNFRCPKPTLERSPGVSRLNPEGQFQGPAWRRSDTAVCFRRHNPFNRLQTLSDASEEYDPVIIWGTAGYFILDVLRCHFDDAETVLSVQWSVLLHFLSKWKQVLEMTSSVAADFTSEYLSRQGNRIIQARSLFYS